MFPLSRFTFLLIDLGWMIPYAIIAYNSSRFNLGFMMKPEI
jgi:hypothetical protein